MSITFFIHIFAFVLITLVIILYVKKSKAYKYNTNKIFDILNKKENVSKTDCFSHCFEIIKIFKDVVNEIPSKLHFYNLTTINEKPFIKYLISFYDERCFFNQPNDIKVIKNIGSNGVVTEIGECKYLVKLMKDDKTFAFFYLETEKKLKDIDLRYLKYQTENINKLIFE